MKYLLLLLIAVFCLCKTNGLVVKNTTKTVLTPELFRLFDNVNLESYNVYLTINSDLETFSGSNKIALRAKVATNSFRINNDGLTGLDNYDNYLIQEVNVKGVVTKTHFIEKIILCNICQTLTLYTKDAVPENGRAVINIKNFAGKLATNFKGLYLTKTKDGDVIIASNFKPVYARKVFPCFDEPRYLAVFTFQITFPRKAVSSCSFNTPRVVKYANNADFVTFIFKPTPIISVHMINIVLSNYKSVTKHFGKKQLTIFSRANGLPLTKFPAAEALKLINELQKSLRVNFEFNELSLYALPDMKPPSSIGWGLITFSENDLLYRTSENSTNHMSHIIQTLAYAFSSMYVQKFVPLSWWTDAWLSEALAKWIAHILVKKLYPDIILTILEYSNQQNIVDNIAPDAEPLATKESLVFTTATILQQFQSSKINKAFGVIVMIHNILGSQNFKKAMENFLKNNQNQYLDTDVFFNNFDNYTNTTKVSVKLPATIYNIVYNWINLPGMPVINVKKTKNSVTVIQDKITTLISSYKDVVGPIRWYIPVSFSLISKPDFDNIAPNFWLTPDSDVTIKDVLQSDNDATVFNNQPESLFMVNYDNPLLKAIAETMKKQPDLIDERLRSDIVFNVMTLSQTTLGSFKNVLSVIKFLPEDNSYKTWSTTLKNLGDFLLIIGPSTKTGTEVIKYITTTIEKLIQNIDMTITENTKTVTPMQILVLEWGCIVNNPVTLKIVTKLFDSRKQGNQIPHDLFGVVCTTAIRQNPKNWFVVFDILKTATDGFITINLIRSLASTDDITKLLYLLEQIIKPDAIVKKQFYIEIIRSILEESPSAVDAILQFLLFRTSEVIQTGIDVVNEFIFPLSEKITTAEQVCQLNALICCNCQNLITITEEENQKIWRNIAAAHMQRLQITKDADDFFSE